MGKSKRERRESEPNEEPNEKRLKSEQVLEESVTNVSMNDLSYDQKIAFTSVIAKPMASKKLAKKLFKLMRKAGKISRKTLLRVGLKDVQLRIRKGFHLIINNLFNG